MNAMRVWDGDWKTKVRSVARGMGHDDVYEYVNSNPSASMGELFGAFRAAARDSGIEVAMIQFTDVFYEDARTRDRLRDAVMDFLVRNLLHHMPSGWGRGTRDRERRGKACEVWILPTTIPVSFDSLQTEVLNALLAASPPDDWCPASIEDPLIQSAFSDAWVRASTTAGSSENPVHSPRNTCEPGDVR